MTKDTGVPLDELFTKKEQKHLKFWRWFFRGNPEAEPTDSGRRMWRERPRETKPARRIQPGPDGRGMI